MGALNVGDVRWSLTLNNQTSATSATITGGLILDSLIWGITAANEMAIAVSEQLAGLYFSDTTFARCQTEANISDPGGNIVTDSFDIFATGTRATDVNLVFPPQCAYIIQKRTIFGGRSNRGRWYMPFVSQNDCSEDGRMLNDTVDLLTAVGNGVLGLAGGALPNVVRFVILHANGNTPTGIDNCEGSLFMATQRRRLSRVS